MTNEPSELSAFVAQLTTCVCICVFFPQGYLNTVASLVHWALFCGQMSCVFVICTLTLRVVATFSYQSLFFSSSALHILLRYEFCYCSLYWWRSRCDFALYLSSFCLDWKASIDSSLSRLSTLSWTLERLKMTTTATTPIERTHSITVKWIHK